MNSLFRPKIIDSIKDYSLKNFQSDFSAGVTVGIVALPLAMAFAIASGVTPEAGLFTAIIAGFIISAFGGSSVQIGGPTGAFVVIVYGILAQYGPVHLAVCTMLAGLILVIMGVSKLGGMIKFIPYPVTMGFTSGIAVLIFSTQIQGFLGIAGLELPSSFVPKMAMLFHHLREFDLSTTLLAIGSFVLIRFWPTKIGRRIPGSIVALVIGTLIVVLFKLPVETIGTKFGGIPQGFPTFEIPDFSQIHVRDLISPSLTIAMLAAIESLLSAVVADGMIDERHDSNQELMAQGLANIFSPLFGGIAATGAIARTATNIRNGGRTPVAGIVHAATLLVILLVAAPVAQFIPLGTLSAILIVVALNMGEWHHFSRLHKWPISDAVVFLAVFLLTVLIDLTVAVEVGMVLAAVLFIHRIAQTTQISEVNEASETEGNQHSLKGKQVPDDVLVYRIFGSFSFGVADRLETALKRAQQTPKVLIIRMRKVLYMDATGLNALEDLFEKLQSKGQHLILVNPKEQPFEVMQKAGFLQKLGSKNVCSNIDQALEHSKTLLNPNS